MTDDLEALLTAARGVDDQAVRAVYVARARAALTHEQALLASAEINVRALETELVRMREAAIHA